MSEVVRVGDVLQDFSLETFDPSTGDFGSISLAELKKANKWTVLVFYPADYTFVCPTELRDLGNYYEKIKAAGAEVISVSTDTKFVHLAWQREEMLLKDIKYPMGSDPNGKVSRLFGVYDDETGLDLRGTFIINPEGKLTGAEVNFFNVGRNFEELARKVTANTYLAEHPEEACPAGWTEGDKTLKPGADLVGRVSDAFGDLEPI